MSVWCRTVLNRVLHKYQGIKRVSGRFPVYRLYTSVMDVLVPENWEVDGEGGYIYFGGSWVGDRDAFSTSMWSAFTVVSLDDAKLKCDEVLESRGGFDHIYIGDWGASLFESVGFLQLVREKQSSVRQVGQIKRQSTDFGSEILCVCDFLDPGDIPSGCAQVQNTFL